MRREAQRIWLHWLICAFSFVFLDQTDKKAFDELVSENDWSLSDDGKSVVIRAAGAPAPTSSHKEGKEPRAEYPSMEALAKMIATSL